MTTEESDTVLSRVEHLCRNHWGKLSQPLGLRNISEFPIVRKDGRPVDIAMLWSYLKSGLEQIREPNGMLSGLSGDGFHFESGVGRTILQIHPSKHHRLDELWAQSDILIERVLSTANPKDITLLGYGRQPLAEPSSDMINQKFEYFSVLKGLNEAWTPFSTAAHEKCVLTVPYSEQISILSLLNWLWPVYVSLFGNDGVINGEDSYRSNAFLHQIKKSKSDIFRLEVPKRWFKWTDWIKETIQSQMLVCRDEEDWLIPHQGCFQDWAGKGERTDEVLWAGWCDHLKYTFPFAQINSNGEIVLRYIPQQMRELRHSIGALTLGIASSHKEIWSFIHSFYPDDEPLSNRGLRMHEIFEKAMAHERDPRPAFGTHLMDAINYGLKSKPAFTGLIEGVLRFSEDALIARGYGEEHALSVLWGHIEDEKNPAQLFRAHYAREGMPALLEHYQLDSN
jgi:hypothetical protein